MATAHLIIKVVSQQQRKAQVRTILGRSNPGPKLDCVLFHRRAFSEFARAHLSIDSLPAFSSARRFISQLASWRSATLRCRGARSCFVMNALISRMAMYHCASDMAPCPAHATTKFQYSKNGRPAPPHERMSALGQSGLMAVLQSGTQQRACAAIGPHARLRYNHLGKGTGPSCA